MHVTVPKMLDVLSIEPGSGLTLTDDDGTQWVIRRSNAHLTNWPKRIEIMLVPGTGPQGESDVSLRAVASNTITVEAVGW